MKVLLCFIVLIIGAFALIHEDPLIISNDRPDMGILPIAIKEYSCKGHRHDRCKRTKAPACGWFDSDKIRCFAYPCAGNFKNPCKACKNKDVKSVTCGKCPDVGNANPMIKYIRSNSHRLPKCYTDEY